MDIRKNKKLMMAVALVVLLNISSCSTYDDGPTFSLKSKKARLTNGDWEVVKIDDERLDGDITLEFEKDGDFAISVEYSYYGYSYSYTYDGEWEWEDGKETIQINFDDTDNQEFEVKRLTNEELWFDDEENDLWECEKV